MLSKQHLEELEARSLDPELATHMGIYSGRRSQDGSIGPASNGNILCFPYFEGDDEVTCKYRWTKDGQKRFMQQQGRPKTFFNCNALRDPDFLSELEAGSMALLITEGEPDCVAAVQAGHYTAVSVPNGAQQPARDQKTGALIHVPMTTEGLDMEADEAFSYLFRNQEFLSRVKHFYIAVDADEVGQRLGKELVRRLGPARCFFLEYPKDPVIPAKDTGELRPCKDLNEVLQAFGEEGVRKVIAAVKPWPMMGLFSFADYPDEGDPEVLPTKLCDELDELFLIYPGAFIPVTGVPNTGKSEVVKQIAVNMGIYHGWHTAMFAGEEPVKPFLERSIKTKYLGKERKFWTPDENRRADEFLARHFQIIGADPRGDEEEITIDKMLELAAASVFRYGTRLLIIDPWNELEHERDTRMTLTEYVGAAIRKIKRFAKLYGVCVIVVAHPKKVESQPTLYDISDSAHWYNKADLALIIDTDNQTGTIRDFIVAKVRFSGIAGRKGVCQMDFHRDLGMYKPVANLNTPLAVAA
jgi:twinkle protein